jgi:multidrug transporter EmrE-like cation transporter
MQVLCICLPTQVNYLNKALDSCQTAIVSPLYYVMFTVLTIVASVTLFQEELGGRQVVTELCGFLTIVSGTFLLRYSREEGGSLVTSVLERTRAGAVRRDTAPDDEVPLALSGISTSGEPTLTLRGNIVALSPGRVV